MAVQHSAQQESLALRPREGNQGVGGGCSAFIAPATKSQSHFHRLPLVITRCFLSDIKHFWGCCLTLEVSNIRRLGGGGKWVEVGERGWEVREGRLVLAKKERNTWGWKADSWT